MTIGLLAEFTRSCPIGSIRAALQRSYYQRLALCQRHRHGDRVLSAQDPRRQACHDALFIEKLRDVAGLYLQPSENALVMSVDEKSQCRAFERTQPMLPLGLGYVEGITHDYQRHRTTTLFAALDVLSGTVLTACKPRHRHQEFLAFRRCIDKSVPEKLDIHLIVDNYSTHEHARVKAWLARHPRWHIHFIPTYRSWLNQVGRFFGTSPRRPSAGAPSAASSTVSPSYGLPRRTPCLRNLKDLPQESVGQNTLSGPYIRAGRLRSPHDPEDIIPTRGCATQST